MIGFIILGAAASVAIAADPCSQVCDEIPGACGPDGSRCVDQVCTDLFWYNGALCNSSMRGCPDRYPLMCKDARILMGEADQLGVVAHVARAPVGALNFAPGQKGRRGFEKMEGLLSSQLASILQVVLHSQALRRAIMLELQYNDSEAEVRAAHPILSSIVAVLQRMFGADGEGALDLTEFRFALLETIGFDQSLDDPLRVLAVAMNDLAELPGLIETALTLVSRSPAGRHPRAVEFLEFPTSSTRTRWSIKEMLQANFLRTGESERITHVPELLSIGIIREHPPHSGSTERVNSYVETPAEIDFAGLMEAGETYRYRLVGIVRNISGKYVADYFDADSGEWIHANDTHLHVIQGQPRNGGSDAVMVFYELL